MKVALSEFGQNEQCSTDSYVSDEDGQKAEAWEQPSELGFVREVSADLPKKAIGGLTKLQYLKRQ